MRACDMVVVLVTCAVGFYVADGVRKSASAECLDVAIVGAGVGGTYSGWKLKHRGWKIAIFENTDRVGGRMFSVFLPSAPDVAIDLGAMRYRPEEHPVLLNLLETLGLHSIPFAPDGREKTYYLRGTRLSYAELLTDKLPYNLRSGEPRDPNMLLWKFYQAAMNRSDPDNIRNKEEGITLADLPLYKHGYLDLMGTIWSSEAKQYLRDFFSFQSDFENNNAVHNTPASRPSKTKQAPVIRTVVGGMSTVPQRLAQEFLDASSRHGLRLNQRVTAIDQRTRRGQTLYYLTIMHTRTTDGRTIDIKKRRRKVCAKEVILACPRTALSRIDWAPLRENTHILYAMDSVSDNSAMKIYLTYPSAWLDSLGQRAKSVVSDTPLRQTLEYARFRNLTGHENSVVLVSYVDGESLVDYWSQLRKYPGTVTSPSVPTAYAVSRGVVDHVHHHMGTLFDISPSRIPEPLDGVMQIWRDGPYGAAWELFKPGYKPSDIEAFMRHPSGRDRVFVVSNSYTAGLTFWAEGALRSAEAVINQFFSE